jgi:hypothetical protein
LRKEFGKPEEPKAKQRSHGEKKHRARHRHSNRSVSPTLKHIANHTKSHIGTTTAPSDDHGVLARHHHRRGRRHQSRSPSRRHRK